MKNTYVFDDKISSFEIRYIEQLDKKMNDFIAKYPDFKENIKIDGNYLVFTISEDYEISEHNKIVDFLESNVGNGRAFNGQGKELDEEFYKDLFDLFSNDEGKVMFGSGNYDCKMSTVGVFDSSHYFELKSDGLHWREDDDDDDYDDDDYDDDDY